MRMNQFNSIGWTCGYKFKSDNTWRSYLIQHVALWGEIATICTFQCSNLSHTYARKKELCIQNAWWIPILQAVHMNKFNGNRVLPFPICSKIQFNKQYSLKINGNYLKNCQRQILKNKNRKERVAFRGRTFRSPTELLLLIS